MAESRGQVDERPNKIIYNGQMKLESLLEVTGGGVGEVEVKISYGFYTLNDNSTISSPTRQTPIRCFHHQHCYYLFNHNVFR